MDNKMLNRNLLIVCLMFCASINLLVLSAVTMSSVKIVWDDYVDLCRFTQRNRLPSRPPHRCEKSNDIFVEKRLYRNEEPYWCLSINNTDDRYRRMVIRLDGGWEFRRIDFMRNKIFTRLLDDTDDTIINIPLLEKGYESMVIYPLTTKISLQNILSITLNGEEMCDPSRANETEPIYDSPLNNLLTRFYDKCVWIQSRLHRSPTRCEQQPEIVIEHLNFAGLVNFTCLIFDRRLGMEQRNIEELEMTMSGPKYTMTWTKHTKRNLTANRLTCSFIPSKHEKLVIAIVPQPNENLPHIISVKLNGQIESCRSAQQTTKEPEVLCGQRKIRHRGLITFGAPTYHGQFPWHAALYEVMSGGTTKYICGGTVITRSAILTAAHCIVDQYGEKTPERLRVQLGKFDLTMVNINTQEYSVWEIINHPEFDRNYLDNDISILKLQTLITYTDYIQPICLTGSKREIFGQEIATVPGWGRQEISGTPSTILKVASMPIIPNQECRSSNREFFSQYLTERKFCAGYRNGTSVCTGDSGGGLVMDKSNDYYLLGIVSLGVDIEGECDITQHVIFTDVSEYYCWIQHVIKFSISLPCGI